MDAIETTHGPVPTTPLPAAPAVQEDAAPAPVPAAAASAPLSRERVLDLVALLVLIALAATVFVIAGPAAFTEITSVGVTLFATWRAGRKPSP